MNIDMLYRKIDKYWIGYLCGYLFFIMCVNLGVILTFNFNFNIYIYYMSILVFFICYLILLPIALIRIIKKNMDIKE